MFLSFKICLNEIKKIFSVQKHSLKKVWTACDVTMLSAFKPQSKEKEFGREKSKLSVSLIVYLWCHPLIELLVVCLC